MSSFCMDDLNTKKYWIALSMVPGVGAITYRKLLNVFTTPEQVFSASYHDLIRIPGISDKLARAILHFGFPDQVKRALEEIDKYRVHVITSEDEAYPPSLTTIFDPPPLLYLKGRPLQQHEIFVAVVGSRRASTYGRTVAEQLCREFAVKGVTVVSGMARGIDSAAHRGALQGGGQTIAVLGCGVNVVYPPENERLYHEILEQGAILSEYPLHTKPDRGNFPARNRIISGISLGTVVVEAGARSGALITADTALEQGRDVFAVPGNITSASSQGTNRLIKQGAMLIEHADDVLNALPLEISREIGLLQPELPFEEKKSALPTLSQEEQNVLACIETQPLHIDEITVRSQLPSGKVSATLMMLEMKNLIRQMTGKMFSRV